jgi:hypothetical protein
MSGRLDHLVAIASGTTARVAGWAALLRAAKIRYVTESSCGTPDDETPDYVEIWVHKKDVDAARKILQDASDEEAFW